MLVKKMSREEWLVDDKLGRIASEEDEQGRLASEDYQQEKNSLRKRRAGKNT